MKKKLSKKLAKKITSFMLLCSILVTSSLGGQQAVWASARGGGNENGEAPAFELLTAAQPFGSTRDDAIFDTWTNNAGVAAAVNEVLPGDVWRQLKSAAGHTNTNLDNNVFVIEEADAFADGFFEATIKPNSVPADTRMGFVIRYNEAAKTGAFVGYDPDGWFWQIYNGSTNPWYSGKRTAASAKGTEVKVRIDFTGDKMNVSLDDVSLFQDVDISTLPDAGKVGLKVSSWGKVQSDILFTEVHYTGQPAAATQSVSGSVVEQSGGAAIAGAAVELGRASGESDAGGAFAFPEMKAGRNYELKVNKEGYTEHTQTVAVSGTAITLSPIALTRDTEPVTLSTQDMDVLADPDFPRVIRYTMKTGTGSGKVFTGQGKKLKQITINNKDITPVVTSVTSSTVSDPSSKDKITYTIEAKDTEANIDATITAEIVVKDNTLEFNITEIADRQIVNTIEIKNHSLVSVRSTQAGANLQGANMSTNTHKEGDRAVLVDSKLNLAEEAKKGYMYAFVSNEELSAGLWSNSENKVSADWQRVTAAAEQGPGYKAIGLGSTYWTFQKSAEDRKEDGTIEYENASADGKDGVAVDELPSCKVVITGDINDDSTVDWQDGAIAYRTIMNNPNGAELVPDLVAYRIAMNFGSQAQNPFLMTLDNVKKISLNTDGLGQSILLKGYGSEGHDSGHLDYADIGTRIGGAEEMKVLLEGGKEYGATFGIHVNASETYPESKYFSPDILRKNEDGSYNYGWNWIDQGINIDALYDLRNGRVDRWRDLYDALGGNQNALDFIYVDVWGNGQSGDNGTWASRQLAKEIVGHGWRVAGEWGYANEYDSTFQHWAADLTYGGFELKGINSDIARFIRNHQKDSWVGNYTQYGGAADAPLLGGYNMKDFEGWQGRSDYAAYISTLFEVNLASKFVQHFEVTNWKEGTPVQMTDNGETYSWTPGMEAALKTADGTHTLEIVRKSNDFAGAVKDYRTRTMTYDGKEIYTGLEGDTKYLIPWLWDENGTKLSSADQKMYHWNTNGGETTWEVPADWGSSAMVYRLDDLGKQDGQQAAITNGKITLNAAAKTPYVIHKNPSSNKAMTWSDGMKIGDSGFNSGALAPYWTVDGTGAVIEKSQGANPMLMIKDNVQTTKVSQAFNGLKANTKYAVYVGIDNRSASNAGMKVTGAKEAAGNTTKTSIAENFIKAYAHNTNKSTATVNDKSYFQNMYVFFETGDNPGNVKVELVKEAGAGAVYFDDVRVVAGDFNNWSEGNTGTFTQDFETVAQGIYPFVIGNIENVEDNRTHLAQLHSPYTQRDWNEKKISDVIEGEWSVKTNGLSGYDRLVYQTIPQNIMFESGYSYKVEFDYEAGGDKTYSLVMGEGDYRNKKGSIKENHPLDSTIDAAEKKGSFSYILIPPESGEGWFGIYSNTVKAKVPDGLSKGEVNFRSYNDFILDNLKITKSELKKEELKKLIDEADKKLMRYYTKASWQQFEAELKESLKIYNSITVTQAETDAQAGKLAAATAGLVLVEMTKEELLQLIEDVAAANLKEEYLDEGWDSFTIEMDFAKWTAQQNAPKEPLIKAAFDSLIHAEIELKKHKGTSPVVDESVITSDSFTVKAGSFQPGGGGEGLAEYAVDGDKNTIWHTAWGGTAPENLWFQFDMAAPTNVSELSYLPRSGAANGTITKYKITVSKDEGASFTEVANGTWALDDKLKEVTFASQDGVTNLRLTALEAKGGFGSAAEIELRGAVKASQDAPAGLTVIDTYRGGRTGSIGGVDSTMQYSDAVKGNYINCTGQTISGLAAGQYFIRRTATTTLKASKPAKVVVLDTEKRPSGGGSTDSGSTAPSSTPAPNTKVEETNDKKTVTTTTETKKEDGSKETVTKKEITDKKTGEVITGSIVKNETEKGQITANVAIDNKTSGVSVKADVQVDPATKEVKSNVLVSTDKTGSKVTGENAVLGTDLSGEEIRIAVLELKKAAGNQLTGAVDVTIIIPAEEVLKQTVSKAIKNITVEAKLPAASDEYKVARLIFSKEILGSAKANSKNLKMQVTSKEGKAEAVWSIDKAALKAAPSAKADLNLVVETISAGKGSPTTKTLVNKDKKNELSKAVAVSFKHGNKLPAAAAVTIPVSGKSGVKAGDSLYLYGVDEKTKKLLEVPNSKYKVSKAGTVAIHVINGADYVLLPAKPDASVSTKLANQAGASASVSAKTGKGTVKVTLPPTLKKTNAFSKKDAVKAITEAKVTYQSSSKSVAKVDKNGIITGLKSGKSVITTTIALRDGSKKTIKSTVTVK